MEGPVADRRAGLVRSARRVHLMQAAAVGIGAGLLACVYQSVLAWAERTALDYGSYARSHPILWVVIPLLAAAMATAGVWLTFKFAPEASGSGIPHVKEVLLGMRKLRPFVIVPVKMVGGALGMISGFSSGREGPTVQMGASIGQLVGEATKSSSRNVKPLIAAGAGAGLGAAFNAPLAGTLFVIEELRKELSATTFGTALIATVSSVAVLRIFLGQHASFHLTNPGPLPLSAMPAAAVIGIVGGLTGVLFNRWTIGGLAAREKFKIPRWALAIGVGLLTGTLLIVFPAVSCSGHTIAEGLMSGSLTLEPIVGMALLVAIGKLALTCLCYSTGIPGGIFAPLLAMGAALGAGVGEALALVHPAYHSAIPGLATIGMVAVFTASIRAPLTGVVLIVEMTSEFGLLYALLIGAFAAYAVSEALQNPPLYDDLVERDLEGELEEELEGEDPPIIELLIEPHSLLDGVKVVDSHLPPGALIVHIERNGRMLAPNGSTVLHSGDHMMVMLGGQSAKSALQLEGMARAK